MRTIRLCRASFVHLKENYVSGAVANLTQEVYLVRMMLPSRRWGGKITINLY